MIIINILIDKDAVFHFSPAQDINHMQDMGRTFTRNLDILLPPCALY